MPAAKLTDLSRCAIHTFTNKPWTLEECIAGYARAGIGALSVWRETIEPIGSKAAAKILADSGMKVSALVRGGFFTGANAKPRQQAIDENWTFLDQARDIGARMLVLVVGATPGVPLSEGRRQVTDGVAAILPHAESLGIKLAIEPLHPVYAAGRSCINRVKEARLVCEALANPMVGIAVDVYHVWWDADLEAEIALAGRQKQLFAFHISDWRIQTRDLLNDRGLMGDGCIDIRGIRGWIEDAGFDGLIEVEIFSKEFWAMDQNQFVEMICRAYLTHA
jgi:sugar phosphate isomerase/epimerase